LSVHGLVSVQVRADPPPQIPLAWQVSPTVQALPSSHEPVLTGSEQAPVAGSQVPMLWHWSDALQVTELVLVQTPA
jgi:hypothetical protein